MKVKQLKQMLNNFDEEDEVVSSFNNLVDNVPLNILCIYKKNNKIILNIEDGNINIDTELKLLPKKDIVYNTYDNFLIFVGDDNIDWFKIDENGELYKEK